MKKNIVAIVCLIAVSMHTSAQKGSVIAGGELCISSTKTENSVNKSSTLNYTQLLGYQFSKKWVAGFISNITHTKNTIEGAGDGVNTVSKSNGFHAGPFIRYVHPLGGIFSIFGQVQGSFGNDRTNSVTGSVTQHSKTSSALFGFTPIVSMHIKNNFAFNFSVGGISYTTSKQDNYNRVNSFVFNFGKSLNIGLAKKFAPKKKTIKSATPAAHS